MRTSRWLSALILAGFALVAAAPASAQAVAKRTAKRAAKEATESAAKDAAGDATKKAVKHAAAPNADRSQRGHARATDEARPRRSHGEESRRGPSVTGLEDPKIKEAIPADALAKLKGKVTVKPAGAAKPADAAAPANPTAPTTSPAEPVAPATPGDTPAAVQVVSARSSLHRRVSWHTPARERIGRGVTPTAPLTRHAGTRRGCAHHAV